MAKTVRRRSTRTRTRKHRGGSSTDYVMKAVGDLQSQVSKALSPASKTNTLSGGSRKRRAGGYGKKTKRSHSSKKRSTRRRRGGFLGTVLSTAVVPFGLWGAQRKLARRMKKKGKK